MKVSSIRLALPTAILAIAFAAAGQAKDLDRADRSKGALLAELEYCKTCHGLSGQGYRGFFPIPRLAGQQTEYIENQLAAFIERRRENKYMYDVAQGINGESSDDEIRQVKNSGPGTRCLCCPLVGRGHGDRQIPELHVVPRRNGARLWGRATIGRAETPIY